jgi:hypothetical protein
MSRDMTTDSGESKASSKRGLEKGEQGVRARSRSGLRARAKPGGADEIMVLRRVREQGAGHFK